MTTDATLGAIIVETIRLRNQMRAHGATADEQAAYLEDIVRRSWPFTREWKYLCERCSDTGLVLQRCRPGARCSGVSTRTDDWRDKPGKYHRLCVRMEDTSYEHEYVEPCWCQAGAPFRAHPRKPDEDLDKIAKTDKPMTRWGR
jgi:hypothetical protein